MTAPYCHLRGLWLLVTVSTSSFVVYCSCFSSCTVSSPRCKITHSKSPSSILPSLFAGTTMVPMIPSSSSSTVKPNVKSCACLCATGEWWDDLSCVWIFFLRVLTSVSISHSTSFLLTRSPSFLYHLTTFAVMDGGRRHEHSHRILRDKQTLYKTTRTCWFSHIGHNNGYFLCKLGYINRFRSSLLLWMFDRSVVSKCDCRGALFFRVFFAANKASLKWEWRSSSVLWLASVVVFVLRQQQL